MGKRFTGTSDDLEYIAGKGETERIAARLRAHGWTVAIHNDYEMAGGAFTFWLWTHAKTGRFVKGEGVDDLQALKRCEEAVRRLNSEPEPGQDPRPARRKPDAMAHATHWRLHLRSGTDGLVVSRYDPDKCSGDGPPWPVWIGSPPDAAENHQGSSPDESPDDSGPPTVRCSFCGKGRLAVRHMASGPSDNVYICDECVTACSDLMADPADEDDPPPEPPPGDHADGGVLGPKAERMMREDREGKRAAGLPASECDIRRPGGTRCGCVVEDGIVTEWCSR